jgi:hypothetical protein
VVRLLVSMFLSAAVAAVFLPVAGAQSQTVTLSVSPQDTFIDLDATRQSAQTTLNLYTWPDYQAASAAILKFDLSAVPADAVIQRAVLRLSLVATDNTSGGYTVTAHRVINKNPDITQATGANAANGTPWTGSGCCQYGIPLAQSDIATAAATTVVATALGSYSWTVTELAREWRVDPSSNYGLLLNPDTTKAKDSYRYFASTEHSNPALRPVLDITYSGGDSTSSGGSATTLAVSATTAAGDTTPPSVRVTSPTAGAAVSGVATLAASAWDLKGVAGVRFLVDGRAIGSEITKAPYVLAWQTSGVSDGAHVITARARDAANNTRVSTGVSVTVSTGGGSGTLTMAVSPADTTLNLDATNYSRGTTLSTYTWPDRTVGNAILLKFNLSAVPAGALIHSATLQMSLVESDAFPETTYTITAHKVLNRNATVASATGYTFNGSSNWTASTCCYNSIPLAQSDISTAYAQTAINKTAGAKTWALTNLVQEWVANPSSNFGVLLNSDKTKLKDRFRDFASMEHPTTSLRPTLRITYSSTGGPAPSPSPTPTPVPTGDTTAPTVSLSAPANGATVSGASSTITAAASDNAGVAGVQFQLDGANLGSEDTAAPYSLAWNTTTRSNGSHTISAVARDAAGNRRTASISVTISNGTAPAPAPTGGSGLASRYPGDVGIENDAAVIFAENFEESSMNEIFTRWGDVKNGPSMTRTSDVPAGSLGTRSLTIPWVGGGVNSGGHLYKVLNPAVNDVIYVRYYIKYPSTGNFHHSGIWVGGNNPVSAWPDPGAGARPTGSDKFIASAEQNNNVTHAFDHYNYYYNMRPDAGGAYWGNLLLNNQAIQAPRNQWACVEHMIKLNNPVSAANGEHAIWLNGTKVSHLGQGTPNGSWSGGIFTQGAGSTPFEGFRWRTSTALNINWIWLQNYSPDDPAGVSSKIMYDHVVVARSYIGCLR